MNEQPPHPNPRVASVRKHLLPICSYIAGVTVFAYLYGHFPGAGSFPLAAYTSVSGWTHCFASGPPPCDNVGYPIGVRPSLALPVYLGTHLLFTLGLGVVGALNLLAIICLAGGIGALWYVGYQVSGRHLAGALAVTLYFGSPVVVNHSGLISLYFGFLFLPVLVAAAWKALAQAPDATWPGFALWSLGLLGSGLLLIYFDPYPYVIGLIIGMLLLVAGAARLVRRGKVVVAGRLVLLALALSVPGLFFQFTQPDTHTASQMPLEMYRALGTDLAHMFIPTQDSLAGGFLGAPSRWDKSRYYGDGSQLASAFFGPILFFTAVGGAILLARQRSTRLTAAALSLSAAGFLALGLGPSLKVLSEAERPPRTGDVVRFDDYLMPADQAVISTPWAGLYQIQPVASMRATYRWHVGLRLVAAVLAAAAVGAFVRRKPKAALLLAALLIIEAAPVALMDARAVAAVRLNQVRAFEQDVSQTFGDRLEPGDRVLFLPAENDYLIMGIAPQYGLLAYNVSFDKELARIRPQQPPEIAETIRSYEQGTLTSHDMWDLFDKDLLDAVVFPDFRLRWDAYRWPPSSEVQQDLRARALELAGAMDLDVRIDEEFLATIVRPR